MEVAVAPHAATYDSGMGRASADLQAFLQEQLHGSGVKRVPSATAFALRRPSAAANFATAAPPPAGVAKPKKKAKVDAMTRKTGQVLSTSTTAMERRAAKLARG